MRLSIDGLAEALNITVGTLERWIRQGSIPARRKGADCEFSAAAMEKWARENNLKYRLPGADARGPAPDVSETLAAAVERGRVFHEIPGSSVAEVLKFCVDRIPCLKTAGHRTLLYESLMAREELMSTGIGRGVAVPHPRTPLDFGDIPAFITTCFLKTPVDYRAVDHQPVFALFLLVCPSAKQHLRLLARLSFCLREEAFVRFLSERPGSAAFSAKIADLDGRFESP